MEDLLLALGDNVNVEEVLAEIERLFALIGLEVNKDKCKCTRTEDITFMGISFSCNKQETYGSLSVMAGSSDSTFLFYNVLTTIICNGPYFFQNLAKTILSFSKKMLLKIYSILIYM